MAVQLAEVLFAVVFVAAGAAGLLSMHVRARTVSRDTGRCCCGFERAGLAPTSDCPACGRYTPKIRTEIHFRYRWLRGWLPWFFLLTLVPPLTLVCSTLLAVDHANASASRSGDPPLGLERLEPLTLGLITVIVTGAIAMGRSRFRGAAPMALIACGTVLGASFAASVAYRDQQARYVDEWVDPYMELTVGAYVPAVAAILLVGAIESVRRTPRKLPRVSKPTDYSKPIVLAAPPDHDRLLAHMQKFRGALQGEYLGIESA